MLGVYIHIPFCVSRCPYCSFSSTVGRDSSARRRYLDALEMEMEHRLSSFNRLRVDTVYIGGGTPSVLSGPEIERLLSMVVSAFQLSHEAEVTAEANPSSSDSERFSILRALGVNRLSIGIQSFDNGTLGVLGRAHAASEAESAFLEARTAGFANIGIDLMFGVPGQTDSAWRDTLDRAICLAPEHVSIYGLSIEEDTPYARTCGLGGLRLPDDESYAAMYLQGVERLANAGYEQYEVSNFSRPGFRSRHNSAYWDLSAQYLGFGAAAHSYVHDQGRIDGNGSIGVPRPANESVISRGAQPTRLPDRGPRPPLQSPLPQTGGAPRTANRFWNTFDADDYVRKVEATGAAESGREAVTPEEQLEETIMLGLRMVSDGLDTREVSRMYGAWVADRLMDNAGDLVEGGLLEMKGEHTLRLTRKGLPVADAVSVELIRSVSGSTQSPHRTRGNCRVLSRQ